MKTNKNDLLSTTREIAARFGQLSNSLCKAVTPYV